MWNPMVLVELAWQVKGGLSHAAAATSFVLSPPPPSSLSKPSRPHYLSYPVASRWEIERESAQLTSPRSLQTMMYRSCLLERGRRRDDPSDSHRSSEGSPAIRLYYAQRHYFSDHPSDPLESLSSSSRGQECARGCSGDGTMFQYERFPSCPGFRVRGRRTSRLAGSSSTGDWSSTPGSRKRSPEEEDIWSKSSVFEFRSVNDPATNTSMYRRGFGDERSDSSALKKSPHPRQQSESDSLPSAYTEDDPDIPDYVTPESSDNDWFRFREKEHLVRSKSTRSNVEKLKEGVSRNSGDSKVELSTQLGLPATATHDELRAEYLVEVKRCHPDMAGDNEFRAKMLERRFQRLTMAWEAYTGECRNPLPEPSAERSTKPLTETFAATETQSESDGTARDRARARAKAEYLKAEARARAATAATQYTRTMDPGRKYLDTGASSC
ncbi:unnamed protein product [Ascophyllum nodosum]